MNIGPLVELALPAALTATLMLVRKKCRFRVYVAVGLACIAAAFGLWFCFPDVTNYHRGPLNAAGFAFLLLSPRSPALTSAETFKSEMSSHINSSNQALQPRCAR
jgi:hypothetical protein